MARLNRPHETPAKARCENPVAPEETIEQGRARRMAALRKIAGIWAEREDIPADGLVYQRALRAEWR